LRNVEFSSSLDRSTTTLLLAVFNWRRRRKRQTMRKQFMFVEDSIKNYLSEVHNNY